MSNEPSRLQRRLEQATADEYPTHVAPDAETASLREGWLALGQLLEAAQPALDEPWELPPPPRRAVPVRWSVAGVAGLAASLVVAVTLAWTLTAVERSGGAASPGARQSALAEQRPQPAPAPGGPNWDDSLDEEIVLAGREVIRIQEDWYHLDDTFGAVQRGLEEIEQDIEDSTL